MSSFRKITKHPISGEYESALWLDDYFGKHRYGVQFDSDNKVYPESQVLESMGLYRADDIVSAYVAVTGVADDDPTIITFLNQLEKESDGRYGCEHFVEHGECIVCRTVIEESLE